MSDVDPETLLEWLSMGQGDEREMQLIALEQLCMLLLMSDNVDRCFESCPPRTFLPALCKIFLDEMAPENVRKSFLNFLQLISLIFIFIFKLDIGSNSTCNHILFRCFSRMHTPHCCY